MNFSAQQIANFVDGEIVGNHDCSVTSISSIENAEPGTLSFLSNPKYSAYLESTDASIVITSKDLAEDKNYKGTLILVENPQDAIAQLISLHDQMTAKPKKNGVHSGAIVHQEALIDDTVFVDAFSVVEQGSEIGEGSQIHTQVYIGANVKIGANCIIYPGVKIYKDTQIGDHCIIHANTVIGSDGFGFNPDQNGVYQKIPHLGNVILESNIEIGANCTIDRATLGSTKIKEGVKLDNQIHIAHNVQIDKHTVIAAQTGVAGSTKIGSYCMIGGQVGFVGHITVGDQVKIQAQSGVARSLKDKSVVQGTPSIDYTNYNKSYVHFKNLEKIENRLRTVEKELKSKHK